MPRSQNWTTRLHSHPQARKELDVHEVWVADCPRCKRTDIYLRHMGPLADGTLVCRWCVTDDDIHDLARCAKCGQMLPETEFEQEPNELAEAFAAMLGRDVDPYLACRACRAPVDHTRPCARCGDEFTPKRSDARYCSGRCRVAAHRASQRA